MYSICYRESTECIVLAKGVHRMYSICYRESTECIVIPLSQIYTQI